MLQIKKPRLSYIKYLTQIQEAVKWWCSNSNVFVG
jgi:hypothetical protein